MNALDSWHLPGICNLTVAFARPCAQAKWESNPYSSRGASECLSHSGKLRMATSV